MKMLICLHGNPLNGQEFEPMLPELQSLGFNPVIHKRPIKGSKLEPLLQSINATAKVSGGGPFGLVAYSWGAYLALAYLRRFPENVTGVLLVNPFLIDAKPIGIPARFFLATPLISTLVLKLRSRKMASAFVNKTFYPEEASEEVKGVLEPYLSHAYIWRGAAAYKKLMVASPLPVEFPNLQVPVKALFGEIDEVAPKSQQMKVLENLNSLTFDTIKDAGHALPWTHKSRIIDEIKRMG